MSDYLGMEDQMAADWHNAKERRHADTIASLVQKRLDEADRDRDEALITAVKDLQQAIDALREARPYVLWVMEELEADDAIRAAEILAQVDATLLSLGEKV